MRHLPGLSEATEGGTVEHRVALRGLTATVVGQSKGDGWGGRQGTNGAEKMRSRKDGLYVLTDFVSLK